MRWIVRVAVLIAVAAAMLFPAGAANAAVQVGADFIWPSGAAVGSANLAASITVTNLVTSPNQNDTLTVTLLRLAPSCGAALSGTTVCPTPDPGVYSLPVTGSGAAGTACVGITFSISAADPSGTVTLSPSASVVLQPPGGSPGSDRCTVNLLVGVTRVPAIDVNAVISGTQTSTNVLVRATGSPSNLLPTAGVSQATTVNRGTPGLSTTASVVPPSAASDTATLTAAGGGPVPTGTVFFRMFGPDDNCMGTPQTAIVPITSGSATSPNFPTPSSGVYRFVAIYSGDTNYVSLTGLCNDAGESVSVVIPTFPQSLPGVVAASVNWSLRSSLTTGGPTTGPFTFGTKPPALVPLAGDWDGNGSRTPGVFQGGAFKLSNTNTANATPATSFTFGNPRGFPVAGDFDGNGTDDVAVVFNGTWQIHYLGAGAPADAGFTFGSGIWPNVVPVAGDWNADGTDGIGYHCRVAVTGCPAGTWNLRNTATAGIPDAGSFLYTAGAATPYPVVGDWDADGTSTVGVRSGATWLLKNTNTAGATPDIAAFDFGGINDLPVVWAQ